MTREERLNKPCRQNHPLSGRWIQDYHSKKRPYGNLRCRFCDADSSRGYRALIPLSLIRCFPDKQDAAKQIAKALHHADAHTAARWLSTRRARPWEVRQLIAAMELGLITHPGIRADEAIPYDKEIDVELCNLSQSLENKE